MSFKGFQNLPHGVRMTHLYSHALKDETPMLDAQYAIVLISPSNFLNYWKCTKTPLLCHGRQGNWLIFREYR